MISYKIGNAVYPEPINNEKMIIAHVCNDIGAWGAGFVLSLSKRWKEPENRYRNKEPEIKYRNKKKYILGEIQLIHVEDNIVVCNMIAQNGLKSFRNPKPLSYEYLYKCLLELNHFIGIMKDNNSNFSVHMPRIGCGLAGGQWEIVKDIIKQTLEAPVVVYDLD